MLAGRHVIAPWDMGSDEFLHSSSADRTTGTLAPAAVDVRVTGQLPNGAGVHLQTVGAQGLTSRALWYEPDLVALGDAMKRAYQTRTRTIEMFYNPADRFGYAAVGTRALQALESIES